MNELTMARADVRSMLWHAALYGLTAIVEESGEEPDLMVWWTGGMEPRPTLAGSHLDHDSVDEVVRAHATRHTNHSGWVMRDIELKRVMRGLMSPRITTLGPDDWIAVRSARRDVISQLEDARAWLDLRMLAALGEPSYWSHDRQGSSRQDDGASRFEMQPRNRGSEFVGSRLRKLAGSVAARAVGTAALGLTGATLVDEISHDSSSSSTPTGLMSPSPTDNAVAWCALWGISQLPIAPRVNLPASTSGHLGRSRTEWFYAPVWHQPWRPARLRTMLASEQLRDTAADTEQGTGRVVDAARRSAAHSWLAARGVVGVVRFPIRRFGSDSAPERRAMRGTLISVGER